MAQEPHAIPEAARKGGVVGALHLVFSYFNMKILVVGINYETTRKYTASYNGVLAGGPAEYSCYATVAGAI